jgi:hypothetical protein
MNSADGRLVHAVTDAEVPNRSWVTAVVERDRQFHATKGGMPESAARREQKARAAPGGGVLLVAGLLATLAS